MTPKPFSSSFSLRPIRPALLLWIASACASPAAPNTAPTPGPRSGAAGLPTAPTSPAAADVPSQPLALKRNDPEPKAAETKPSKPPLDVPIDVNVPFAPAVFRADDKNHLAYELHVTNLSSREITLRRIEVTSTDKKTVLARAESAELAAQISRPGAPNAAGLERLTVGPGLRAVVFLWLDVESPPPSIEHRIDVGVDSEEMSVQAPPLRVVRDPAVVLAPPLRGGDWMAANGPSNPSHHRRALLPIRGRALISQRFAIDWVRVKDDKTFSGAASKNGSYYAYGAEVLAVADGVVAAIKDGIPENTPGDGSRAVPITLETISGNHAIVDLGRGRYAFYAHLQPGSLRVKLGDHVHRGQVLGLLGNSGNSTQPHLHFHVSDASSPLGSEGVPYAFESFEARGAGEGPFKLYSKQLPTENEVVRFPDLLKAR